MPKREDERWALEKEDAPRCCPACQRYGRYYYDAKLGCWSCGWCGRSFYGPYAGTTRYRDELEEHQARTKAREKRTRRQRKKRGSLVTLSLIAILILVAFVPVVRSQWQPYLDRLSDFVQDVKTDEKGTRLPNPTSIPTVTPRLTQTQTPAVGAAPTITQGQTPSPTLIHKTSPLPAPTSIVTPAPKLEELVQYMLELINKDRQDSGLSPVTLGNNTAAQKHAAERLANDYHSHWGMDGMKPYMRYTIAGGFNYEAENVFVTRTAWLGGRDPFYKRDPKEMLNGAEESLMGSPGHRRNILNKWHKKVNIGIAYNNESLHLVQQFEGDYIEFSKLPSLSGGILSMSGKVNIGTVAAIALYYDPLPQPLTREQLEAPPYDDGYDAGTQVGVVIPPPPPGSFYTDLPPNSVQASLWDVSPSGSFVVEANISSLLKQGKGVYTVVIWAKIDNESIDLTNFSIFVQ